MIKKILNISQIGRFRAFGSAADDLSFARNTFIFGKNTHGKSTLTAILRSLDSQNPDFIIGRRTFQSERDQEVCIQFDNDRKLCFKNGNWSGKEKIEIFDRRYIADNTGMATIDLKSTMIEIDLSSDKKVI